VQRLEAHVASLTDEVEARRREVGQLHTLLAQTNQRLLTAEASATPGAPVVAGEAQNGRAEVHDTPPAEPWPETRRWWQRLLWV